MRELILSSELQKGPNCDVPLSVHIGSQGKKWLSCHWCDHKSKLINNCPDCNSNAFKPFGIGTQRVIEFLNGEFPHLRVLRFDRDTTSGKDGIGKTTLLNCIINNDFADNGTVKWSENAKIPVIKVSDFTNSPEILGGRVKTLHPKIHGGILAKRNDEIKLTLSH